MPGYETWITLDAAIFTKTAEFKAMEVEKRGCLLQTENPFKNDPIMLIDVS